jgi:hypothetical protein
MVAASGIESFQSTNGYALMSVTGGFLKRCSAFRYLKT